MEIILAIVVASAVIFFGALISMGNERQRKAIDGLTEQVVLWAVQDLKIKREHLARTVQVPDPLGWLNKAASKVYGYDMKLQILEMFEEQQALVCTTGDGSTRVVFSLLSPANIQRLKNIKQNRLSKPTGLNLFPSLTKKANLYEMSVLNCGMFFDIELHIAWKLLTGQDMVKEDQLWMYVLS